MFLKSVNKGSILYEYSVCLLHFYEPEGKLGNKVWLTKQSKKNTIKKTWNETQIKKVLCAVFSYCNSVVAQIPKKNWMCLNS